METDQINQIERPRIVWIDIMRGLLMFWVIFGHITEDPEQINYIYSFHMPAYFFLTGMTFAFRKDRRTWPFIFDKVFGLLVPYLVLNFYAAPFREWLEYIGEANSQSFLDLLIGVFYSNADSGYKMASNTLWFIPCLFLSTLLLFFISKLCSDDLKMMTAFTGALVFSCWVAHLNTGSGGPSHYCGAIFSVVFLLAGYVFSQHMAEVQRILCRYKWLAAALIPVLLTAGWRMSTYNGYVSIIRNEYKSLLLFYASALLTTLAITVFLILLTQSETAVRLLRPVDFIGRRTLPYIAFQVPFMKLMWYYMAETFGTKMMPWLLIQTVVLYFGMMPFAWAVDQIVPRRSKLKQAAERKLASLPAGNRSFVK